MPEKQKPRDRKDLYTAFVAIAMTMLLTLWNVFANHDRSEAEIGAASDSTLQKELPDACFTSTPQENTGARCITITRTRSS